MKKPGAFTFNTTREGIEARLGEMEMKTDRLRSMYESYFMGMERMPPNGPRRDMNRMMLELQQVVIANASLRFRFQALSQKWVLHTTYWNRTMREIEAGTYRRDVARAQRHMAQRGGVLTEEEAIAIGIPKSRVKAFIAHQQREASKKPPSDTKTLPETPTTATATTTTTTAAAVIPSSPPRTGPPPIPAHARRSPAPDTGAPPLPGLGELDFENAYQSYRAVHQQLGLAAEVPSKENLRARLGKQLPKILAAQQCERVRIEVTAEDGKVRLRAWPVLGPVRGPEDGREHRDR